jgi:hypothetical protein
MLQKKCTVLQIIVLSIYCTAFEFKSRRWMTLILLFLIDLKISLILYSTKFHNELDKTE